MFSWPSLHERMCQTWGLNSGPLACQANLLPIELPCPVKLKRDVTQKIHIQELWFLHSACHLLVLNICMKFYEYISNSSKVIVLTWFCHGTANYQLQRDVTQKIHIQELWFLHSACHLLVLNICMKFHEYILNISKVTEWTQFCQETAT